MGQKEREAITAEEPKAAPGAWGHGNQSGEGRTVHHSRAMSASEPHDLPSRGAAGWIVRPLLMSGGVPYSANGPADCPWDRLLLTVRVAPGVCPAQDMEGGFMQLILIGFYRTFQTLPRSTDKSPLRRGYSQPGVCELMSPSQGNKTKDLQYGVRVTIQLSIPY